MQVALLRSVGDVTFGDLQLGPERMTLVAAANPPEESARGCELAPPLANRFVHHTGALDWEEAFPRYWGSPPRLVFGSRKLDPATWGKPRATVAAYVRVRLDLLLKLPRVGASRGQTWPSPRT